MIMIQISIIIPVYNVAAYIKRCIKSITQQGVNSDCYEIIAVNDGSTDDSLSILQQLKQTVPNLTVYSKSNAGPSVARNFGISNARGRYLMFVDPDDWVMPDSFNSLYRRIISLDQDIIGYEFIKVTENLQLSPYGSRVVKAEQEMSTAVYLLKYNLYGVLWGYLFKREMIENQNIRMIEGIFHQDEDFVARAFYFSDRVIHLDLLVYCYYQRATSTVNRKDRSHRERLICDSTIVIQNLVNILPLREKEQSYNLGLKKKINYLSLDVIRLLVREQHEPAFINKILTTLKAHQIYPLPAENYDFKYRLFRVATSHPALICFYAANRKRIPLASSLF